MRFFKKYPVILGFALALTAATATILTLPRLSLAQVATNTFNRSFNIIHAAGIFVTPRGQSGFSGQIPGIFQRNGVDLSKGLMPVWKYESPEAIRLNQLPARFHEYAGAMQFLRDHLKDWLSGFNLRDPRFAVQVKNAGYEADGLSFNLRPDLDLTHGIGSSPGVGFVMDIKIPSLRIHTDTVRGRDLNNEFLGTFGINHPWIQLKDKRPLIVSIPLRAKVIPGGGLELEAMTPSTNIAELHFASGNDRPLIMPKVQLQIGDRTSTLDARQIEDVILHKEPELIHIFQFHLSDFIRDQLPGMINETIINQLATGFESVKNIDAPGIDPFGTGNHLAWGLRLADLGLNSKFLFLNLDGYVTDPDVTWDEKLKPVSRANPPALTGMDPKNYDFALAVNAEIVNRILEHGFRRGAFTNMKNNGDAVNIVRPPTFSAIGGSSAKLHLAIEQTTSGVQQSLGLISPFQVELDLVVKLQMSANGKAFDMVIERMDEGTSTIDNRFVRFDRFRGDVASGLRDELRLRNAIYRDNFRTVADAIEVPTDLFNLPIQLLQAEIDANGYLVFYMAYGSGR